MRASSDGQGRGATFTVTLPTAPSDTQGASDPDAAPRPCPSATALRGACILVVDDDPDARELLFEIIKSEGGGVVASESADQALEVLRAPRVDVIVCDVGMPDRDGYSFLRELRTSGESAGAWTPAIALTGYATESDSEAALLAGFQMHLPKPVDPSLLLESLTKLWRRGTPGNKA